MFRFEATSPFVGGHQWGKLRYILAMTIDEPCGRTFTRIGGRVFVRAYADNGRGDWYHDPSFNPTHA